MKRALMWDLSPLRPNEYWETCAVDWHEAIAIKRAWQDGIDDVDETEAAKEAIKASR